MSLIKRSRNVNVNKHITNGGTGKERIEGEQNKLKVEILAGCRFRLFFLFGLFPFQNI